MAKTKKLKKHRLYAKVNYLGLKIEKLEKELKELKTQKTVSRLKQIKEKIDKRKAARAIDSGIVIFDEPNGGIQSDELNKLFKETIEARKDRSKWFQMVWRGDRFYRIAFGYVNDSFVEAKPNNKLTAEKVEIGKWYKDGDAYLCPFKHDHLKRVFTCFGFGAKGEVISEITLSEDVVEVAPKDVKSLFYLHEKTYKPNV